MDDLDKYQEMRNAGKCPLDIAKRAYLDNFDQDTIKGIITKLFNLDDSEANRIIHLLNGYPSVKYLHHYETLAINGQSAVEIFKALDQDKRFCAWDAMEVIDKLFCLSPEEIHGIIAIARNYPTDPAGIEKWDVEYLNNLKIIFGDLEDDEEIF